MDRFPELAVVGLAAERLGLEWYANNAGTRADGAPGKGKACVAAVTLALDIRALLEGSLCQPCLTCERRER